MALRPARVSLNPRTGVRVSLNASELAALVGMHAYKSAEEALVDAWRRFDPSSFCAAQKRAGVRIRTVAQTLRSAPEAVSHSVRTAVRASSEASASGVVDRVLQQPLLKVDQDAVARVAASVRLVAQQVAIAASAESAKDTGETLRETLRESSAQQTLRESGAQQALRAAVQSMTCDAQVVDRVVEKLQKLAAERTLDTGPFTVTDTQVAKVLAGPRVAECKVTAAAVASAVNMQRGSRHEEDGVQLYERATGLVVHSKNNCTYVRTLLQVRAATRATSNDSEGEQSEGETSESDDDEDTESEHGSEYGDGSKLGTEFGSDDAFSDAYTVVLCGKVDGLVGPSSSKSEGNKTAAAGKVVEVKCRRGRFFENIPLYEQVQVHAYMFLTRRKSCDLVQKFGQQIRITPVEFDRKFWAGVCGRAVLAARDLLLVRQSTRQQDSLLRAAAAKQQQHQQTL